MCSGRLEFLSAGALKDRRAQVIERCRAQGSGQTVSDLAGRPFERSTCLTSFPVAFPSNGGHGARCVRIDDAERHAHIPVVDNVIDARDVDNTIVDSVRTASIGGVERRALSVRTTVPRRARSLHLSLACTCSHHLLGAGLGFCLMWR